MISPRLPSTKDYAQPYYGYVPVYETLEKTSDTATWSQSCSNLLQSNFSHNLFSTVSTASKSSDESRCSQCQMIVSAVTTCTTCHRSLCVSCTGQERFNRCLVQNIFPIHYNHALCLYVSALCFCLVKL